MTIRAACLLAVLLLVGCGTGVGGLAEEITGPDTAGWEKNWNDTTCGEYLDKMTAAERMAFARWTLRTLRQTTLESAPEASVTPRTESPQS